MTSGWERRGLVLFALGLLTLGVVLSIATDRLMGSDEMTPGKIAVTNPADSPSTVYVLQSFYEDQNFVDGVFSSVAEAEQWMEEIHGFFVRSEPDTMNVYEAGDFTYLITAYEVDDHG